MRTVAIEDARQAGVFERALKHRPTPFVTQLLLDPEGFAHVRIGCNIPSLTHRAISRLPTVGRTSPISTAYRITTNYIPPAKLNRPKFLLTSNRRDAPHEQPPKFRIPLRPEQLRSLNWMLRQEAADSPEFEEEEIAEAILQPLGWRAEAKASRRVRVRGGVLADEVGYGKTAITLGLFACSRASETYVEPGVDKTRGLIPVSGTLVVVPPHLTRQWNSEVEKFIKADLKVVVISTASQLNSTTVRSITKADLVIVASNLFHSAAYLENFEELAGAGSLPNAFGRYWRDRHQVSLAGLREQTRRLQEEGADAVMEHIVKGSKIGMRLSLPLIHIADLDL